MKKAFDAVQYAADDPAKHTVIAWLRSNRIEACVNPDQFGIDILASRNSNKFEIEVEVKHNWKGKDYPFGTVHISTRKEKFDELFLTTTVQSLETGKAAKVLKVADPAFLKGGTQ